MWQRFVRVESSSLILSQVASREETLVLADSLIQPSSRVWC
jgi:hypothetical protein